MFRIRRKTKPVSQPVTPQDVMVPRFVARQLLAILRGAHRAVITMEDLLKTMAPEDRTPYEHLVKTVLRPSFNETMELIDVSEQRGLISFEEAANLRAGWPIENPLPKQDDETTRQVVQSSVSGEV